MARELHKKKNKELYALYSTIIENYITDFLPKEQIKEIWLQNLIKEAKEKVDRWLEEEVDKEVE